MEAPRFLCLELDSGWKVTVLNRRCSRGRSVPKKQKQIATGMGAGILPELNVASLRSKALVHPEDC